MKKIILGIMVFGFVGLVCGSARGQIAENIIKLKKVWQLQRMFFKEGKLRRSKPERCKLRRCKLERSEP